MNKLNVLIAAAFLATGASAEEVNRTIDAAANGTVDVSNISGSVEIRGWSRSQVDISADLGRDVEELVFERKGNQVIIKVEVPRKSSRNIASDLVIHVPEKSTVRVGTVSADIDVEDVKGAQSLNSVSGDIETQAYTADVEAETVSGDIVVMGDGKKLNVRANTVSGDIDIQQVNGETAASTVSGEIQLVHGEFDRVRINTTNGDMIFQAQLNDGGRFSAETINGEIEINFEGKVSAKFEIETFNGSIRNCFGPKAVRTSQYAPGRELNFTEGDGNGWVTVKTLNGDVGICNK
jgi:DUF4097 and DUF4098 domain-containing protein YvlB